MKNLILTFLILASMTVSYGQTNNTAICTSKTSLIEGKEKGIIELKLPESVLKEDVEKYASYYENSFKVNFDVNSHKIKFNMVENTSSNRRIILRFLAANQIQHVIVEDKSYVVSDFYEKFLK
jgi:hypothetical protein